MTSYSDKKLYTIGEVSRLCNISAKALRYYDKIGVISPDYISEENGYRYYSRRTLLMVPVLKYYKQMGFKLEEMQDLLEGSSYNIVTKNFQNKIDQLRIQEQEIHSSYIAVKDWFDLVKEAELVAENQLCEVGVKFLSPASYCYWEQEFDYNYMESIINIPWTNYLEAVKERVTGPVILCFPFFEEKRSGRCINAKIMQKSVQPDESRDGQKMVGGFMAAAAYHIGALERLSETYDKIEEWLKVRGYNCGPECYERYVIDYWTTPNTSEFVTEVMVPISRAAEI